MTNSIEDLAYADTIFLIGSNTTEAHPVIGIQVKRALRRGAKLIVADPRKIELVDFAELWLRQKPGTDVALINGMMHAILSEGLADEQFIAERCEGFEEARKVIEASSVEKAAQITGVDAGLIHEAALHYARAPKAAILYAMGITQHSHGTDGVMCLANLAMVTGNIGRPGTGVNPLRGQNNVQGACDMGCLPNVLPGYQRVDNESARSKFEEAWARRLSDKPGLTIVEMAQAALDGGLKALYIMGENPVLSDPDGAHVEEALAALDFLVVQDIFMTETARHADVVLPTASFAEKRGTFTNTERRVQSVLPALEPPGEARNDLSIIVDVSRKMGRQVVSHHPHEVMDEISRLIPSYGGIDYCRLDDGGLVWPCPTKDHPGTPVLHEYEFARGKGKFHAIEYRPPAEEPDELYPLVLTTGRMLQQFHTGTMTRKSAGLNALVDPGRIDVNLADAERLGVGEGDQIKVTTRRGSVTGHAHITDSVGPGVIFSTFHFVETPINRLTNPTLDPVAKIPELKVCAARVEKA